MYFNSGRKVDVPVWESFPVATVTWFGIVFACMKDLTSRGVCELLVNLDGNCRLTWSIHSENGLIVSILSQVNLFHSIQRFHERSPKLVLLQKSAKHFRQQA